MRRLGPFAAAALLFAACGGGQKAGEPLPETGGTLRLTSPAFTPGGTLPARYTCAGEGVSPPLAWHGVPPGARELTLVVEDRDAGRFVHWTALAIPPTRTGVREAVAPRLEADNSFGEHGWGAPCPPKGDAPHRYVFALYATDAPLGLGADASPDAVRRGLADHGIARGLLTARFGRG